MRKLSPSRLIHYSVFPSLYTYRMPAVCLIKNGLLWRMFLLTISSSTKLDSPSILTGLTSHNSARTSACQEVRKSAGRTEHVQQLSALRHSWIHPWLDCYLWKFHNRVWSRPSLPRITARISICQAVQIFAAKSMSQHFSASASIAPSWLNCYLSNFHHQVTKCYVPLIFHHLAERCNIQLETTLNASLMDAHL